MYRLPDELVEQVRFVRPLNPYKIGDRVSGDEFRTWPETNRRAIVDQGYIELIGGQPEQSLAALDRGALVRVVVPRNDTLFDVVEGRKINETPMTDEAATLLADALPVGLPESPADAPDDGASIEQPPQKKRVGGRPKGSKTKPKEDKPLTKLTKPKQRKGGTQRHQPGKLRREREEQPIEPPTVAAE